MANPVIPQNRVPADPTLKDLLDLHEKTVKLNTNCHAIGTIQSFDPAKQTVTVIINYKKTSFKQLPDGKYEAALTDYPILADVPAIVISGGQCSLQMPIVKGDICLILFNDRDMDNWMQSGQIGPVASPRLHSISDGIALVGLRPFTNPLDGFQAAVASLSNGTTAVRVKNGKIRIENIATTLNTVLDQLVTAIKAISVDVAAIGPNQGTVSAASQLALTNVASQIAGLLE